jgi:hypothetical protein
MRPSPLREAGQLRRLRSRHVDGILVIAGKRLAALRRSKAEVSAEALALRIAAQQRLRHDDKTRAGAPYPAFERQNLFQRRSFPERGGADLQGGNGRLRHQFSKGREEVARSSQP